MSYPNPTGSRPSVALTMMSHHVSFLRGTLRACLGGVEGDLASDGPHPHRERAEREADAYRRLLKALDTGVIVPDDDVIDVVARLAEQTDASNDFEQVLLEHRALCELLGQLGKLDGADGASPEVTPSQLEPIAVTLARIEAKLDSLLAHFGIEYAGSAS